MAWFKKEGSKDGLPELPPLSLPSLSEMEEKPREEKIPILPSFPSSSTGEKISREAVKHLIEEKEEGEMEEKPMFPSIKEMPFSAERSTEKGPIFIQIERYNEVLKDLDEAKGKVNKIHEILKDVKKFKEEEENEITEWETELLKIKEDLNRIDQTIFKKLK